MSETQTPITVKEDVIALFKKYRQPMDIQELLSILNIVRAELLFMHLNGLDLFRDDIKKSSCPFDCPRFR
jgi:predicted Zn-ribbon and HTH transcriptional regulator